MSDFPNPADLASGDLVFLACADGPEVFPQRGLLTVDENRGPLPDGRYEIWTRNSGNKPECFGWVPGDFVYARDVEWA